MTDKTRPSLLLLAGLAFALLPPPPATLAQPVAGGGPDVRAGGSGVPIGGFTRLDQLPAGQLRLKLQALPLAAQERALQWLRSFRFSEADLPALHADGAGGIFYVCALGAAPKTSASETPPLAAAALPTTPFPASLIFHSKPGAANTLYLNFMGEIVTNTQWNIELARTAIPAVVFSTDTDLGTFSDAEQVAIKRIWQRLAEDYSPFNTDVTTERPTSYTTRTAVALITRTTDANGAANPYSTAGGVAYVNVFGTSAYATYRPAWIYHNNLANDESYIAEAAAHEIGHNVGLSHDGKTDGTEYYGGHGAGDLSWGPLMGTGYNRNVSHWSKGEYYLANNTQDDLATIAAKLTYRTDDHGSTPATATALVVTGQTNIVATTPEDDPANLNPANKGVLERNTDTDVFSFVTGSGPIGLAVHSWLMPSGTRGGNSDLSATLYNEAGTLLLSNNPALQTAALVQTDLAEGRYYLYVRNSGAGDPLSATPSGFTAYGSLGQYFIGGFITRPTTYIAPPVAELQIADLTQPGQSVKQFTVTYSDNASIDVSTIDAYDIRVTGPNGYSQIARFVALNTTGDGTPRTATYALTPWGGGLWLPADNGAYTLWMEANQVGDTEGAFVAVGQLGQFQVAVPVALYAASLDADPGWTLEPQWQYGTPAYGSGGPTGGFTGTKLVAYNLSGNYADRLTAKYATTPAINCAGSSSLTLRFKRWLRTRPNDSVAIQVSTNSLSWLNVWSASSAVSDTSWQEVQYPLPAGVAGNSAVRLRWSLASNNSQSDIGWNIDDVELLGDGTLDTTPPVALLSAADVSIGGSPSHSCSVAYTDNTAVRLSSLDATDLLVTGPNGYSNGVEFAGADLPADGSPITATYSIGAPGGVWDGADNGSYSIILLEGAVEDTLNNVSSQTILGAFNVAISTATPGLLAVLPAGGLTASGSVGGPFSPASIGYTLTNTGGAPLDWTASNAQEWVTLSTAGGNLATAASTTVTVSINSAAQTLAVGDYTNSIRFVNTTAGDVGLLRILNIAVSTPPSFPAILVGTWVDSGSFQLALRGQPLRRYAIETSLDFTVWTGIFTNATDSNGTMLYLDAASGQTPTRFYRSRATE